jgi:hypothetical protein
MGAVTVVAARPSCAWCRGPMPAGTRRDAVTCSQRCRQARHRVAVAVRDGLPRGGRDASGAAVGDVSRVDRALQARRFAYADPPYPGKSGYYRDHPDYAGEVDHGALLSRLASYDGWALSTSAGALPGVLALAVAQGLPVRVAAWIRGPRPHATARHALNAWEPVIYVPVARRPGDVGYDPSPGTGTARRVDVLRHGVSPMLALPGRVIGTKPAVFCRWMFDLVGATPHDQLDDLFPGSGMVGRCWAEYTRQAQPPGGSPESRWPDVPRVADRVEVVWSARGELPDTGGP